MKVQRISNTYLPFLLMVFMAMGFFGGFYYLEHENRFTRPAYSTAEIIRTRTLSHRLHQIEFENANLQSQIAELQLKADQRYEDQSAEEIKTLSRFLGMTQREGPGVEVIVKDSAKPLLLGDNPNTGIVHNTDLVQVVNDLRAGGALAVSINGQPITNFTSISCSGPIIIVNGTRITTPFTIQALGNAEDITAYINQPTSFVKELQRYDIEVSINRKKEVVIPGYTPKMAQL